MGKKTEDQWPNIYLIAVLLAAVVLIVAIFFVVDSYLKQRQEQKEINILERLTAPAEGMVLEETIQNLTAPVQSPRETLQNNNKKLEDDINSLSAPVN